jgi:hypothetical protein
LVLFSKIKKEIDSMKQTAPKEKVETVSVLKKALQRAAGGGIAGVRQVLKN